MQAQTGHIHGEIRTSQRHSLVTRRAAVPKSALRRTPVRTRMAAASEKVTFTSSQGHKTVGEYVKADTKSNKCAILCHGYTSHRDSCHFEPLAQAFANAGVNTLRFDFPGNGESEGTFRFGNYLEEVDDINAAKRYLEQQRGQEVVAVVGECVASVCPTASVHKIWCRICYADQCITSPCPPIAKLLLVILTLQRQHRKHARVMVFHTDAGASQAALYAVS